MSAISRVESLDGDLSLAAVTDRWLEESKKINDAIQFFLKRGEGEDALVLSSVKSAGLFPEN